MNIPIKDIKLHPEAVNDLLAGKKFYNQQSQGIGEYFWDSLISDIESLFIYSGIHSKYFSYYRLLSKRFPYAIYYEIENGIAYVLAVLPLRRNPAWLKDQLENRF